jgi:phage terminase large subunit-like protein
MTTLTSTNRADAGQRAVNFFAKRLVHAKGRWAGRPFEPTPSQAEWLRKVFGTMKPDGRRLYRTVYKEVPKKNTKTTTTAGCLLKCLYDEDEAGAEVYSAASTRDQAGIMYAIMAAMTRQSPRLMKHKGKATRLYDRDKRIYLPATGAFYQSLSSDANYSDGINPSAAAVDELHRHRSRDLLDVIQEGMGAREQPLLFILTTAGAGQMGPAWDMHEYARQVLEGTVTDPTFLAEIYAASETDDWEDEAVWYACNPALSEGILDIEDFRRAHRQAKLIPSAQTAFRRLRLNQWSASDTRWIDPVSWDRTAGIVDELKLRGQKFYGGLDISHSQDFTAWAMLFPEDRGDGTTAYRALYHFWLPEDALLTKRMEMAPTIEAWRRAGFLTLTPGEVIDLRDVGRRIMDDCEKYECVELGYDRFHAHSVVSDLMEHGLTLVDVPQTFRALNTPAKEFERLIAQQLFVHGGNPVLRWMVGNAVAETDRDDRIRPSRLKSHDKIDGVLATLFALERALAYIEQSTVQFISFND